MSMSGRSDHQNRNTAKHPMSKKGLLSAIKNHQHLLGASIQGGSMAQVLEPAKPLRES
jgi:hypothetical protein